MLWWVFKSWRHVHGVTTSAEYARLESLIIENDEVLLRLKEKCEHKEAIDVRMFSEMAKLCKEMAALCDETKLDDKECDRKLMIEVGTMIHRHFKAVGTRLLAKQRSSHFVYTARIKKIQSYINSSNFDTSVRDENKSILCKYFI